MTNRESEFPKRMSGIWRAGALRPSDTLPETPMPRSARRQERAQTDHARAAARDQAKRAPETSPSGEDLQAVLAAAAGRVARGSGGSADDVKAELRAAGGELLQRLRETRRHQPAEKATRTGPRRRSFLGWLIHKLIVIGFLVFVATRILDIDLEQAWSMLLDAGETLLEETIERQDATRGSGSRASAPAATELEPPVPPGGLGAPDFQVRNGSFESPTLDGEADHRIPAGWNPRGPRPYLRLASGAHGYPPAPDGRVMLALEGESEGVLYQDLGHMQAGKTYTLRAIVLHSSGENAYRVSFVRKTGGTELAYISEQQVSPPEHDSFPVGLSYTATDDDHGKWLRVSVSDNGSERATRTAIDAISIRAE